VITRSPTALIAQRLIQIAQQVIDVFETDRDPQHALRDAGRLELRVGVSPLRREHGQADEALDAAQACGAADHLQAIEGTRRPLVVAAKIDAPVVNDHFLVPSELIAYNLPSVEAA